MSLVDYPLFSWVVGSRTRRRTGGLQQILYTRKLTVQEERSPDDELLESSKHVESE